MQRRFSRLAAGLRVGAGFFERGGLRAESAAEAPPRGVVDRMSDLAHPGIDVARVHPAVVVFFEDTQSLELRIESRWRFPFSIAWRLVRPLLRVVGQLVLPVRDARIFTRVHAIDAARDGRERPRAVVRTYADGGVMQVVAYATFERAGARFMSAAFPLPAGHLAGLLRLDPIAEDDEGRLAVALTSARARDDAGVWLVAFGLPLRLPFGERLALFGAGTSAAPRDLDPSRLPGATIVGRHEQRLFGVRIVTHDYWFRPRADRALPAGSGT